MIGAQSSRLKTAPKAIDYIFNTTKTTSELCDSQYLDLEEPLDAWDSHPMHHTDKERQFIHAMLCPYGDKVPTIEELKALAKGVMNLFNEYPLFTAIHVDHPQSPHIHVLMHPRNVFTDKVWQQSPKDLVNQKKSLSKLLKELNLYGLTHNSADRIQEDMNITNISTTILGSYNEQYLDEFADNDEMDLDVLDCSDIIMLNTVNSSLLSNIWELCHPLPKEPIFTKITNGIEACDLLKSKEFTYVKKIR